MPLDVPVQQLDNRVERIVFAVLIPLRDERSHNLWERAAIVPNILSGNAMSSGVAKNTPEDLFPGRAGS